MYSTTPIIIGKTSNGHTVYQKTINTVMTYFTKPTSGYSVSSISLGDKAINILKIDTVINSTTASIFYQLPYSSTGSSLGTWIKSIKNLGTSSDCIIEFYNNVEWGNNYVLTTTVEYIKSEVA